MLLYFGNKKIAASFYISGVRDIISGKYIDQLKMSLFTVQLIVFFMENKNPRLIKAGDFGLSCCLRFRPAITHHSRHQSDFRAV